MPGDTATRAFSSSSFANSSDPSLRNGSGIRAQTNIDPRGGATSQPPFFRPSISTSRRFWYTAQIFRVSASHSRSATIDAIWIG